MWWWPWPLLVKPTVTMVMTMVMVIVKKECEDANKEYLCSSNIATATATAVEIRLVAAIEPRARRRARLVSPLVVLFPYIQPSSTRRCRLSMIANLSSSLSSSIIPQMIIRHYNITYQHTHVIVEIIMLSLLSHYSPIDISPVLCKWSVGARGAPGASLGRVARHQQQSQ